MSIVPEPAPESADPPSAPLVSAGSSDRCTACGAHMATDQRYCVECGTRRGAPRFSLAGQSAAPAAANVTAPAPGSLGGSGASRVLASSGVVLLTGLLVILIALGVGVLIGHNNSPKASKGANVTVIEGSSPAASTSPAVSVQPSGSAGTAASSTSKSSAKATTTPAKQATAAAAATNPSAKASGKSGTAAAAKSFSPTATKSSTLGGKCTPGSTGCSSSGKQTGNLF